MEIAIEARPLGGGGGVAMLFKDDGDPWAGAAAAGGDDACVCGADVCGAVVAVGALAGDPGAAAAVVEASAEAAEGPPFALAPGDGSGASMAAVETPVVKDGPIVPRAIEAGCGGDRLCAIPAITNHTPRQALITHSPAAIERYG